VLCLVVLAGVAAGCAAGMAFRRGEVNYGELTEPGRLRHPVWRGLRPDKSPNEVVWERPAGA